MQPAAGGSVRVRVRGTSWKSGTSRVDTTLTTDIHFPRRDSNLQFQQEKGRRTKPKTERTLGSGINEVKVMVNQSRYRPGVAQRVPGS